jgi:perosamine synthetase
MGLDSADEVIVPDYTMIASPNAVRWMGGQVALCDVEADTLCMDLETVPVRNTTKALMYVAINGRSGNMEEVVDFCRDHDLLLIEDACQALGSKWNNQYLGTFGDVGVFSFSPHKIITTGQGGAIVTNNEEIYTKVKQLKDFARVKPGVDQHTGIGYNFKFTDLQSVIGIEQLNIIEYRMQRKRELYRRYLTELEDLDYLSFLPLDVHQQVPWFIDVLVQTPRDQLVDYLKAHQIGSRPFYPPIHWQKPYVDTAGTFPVTSTLAPTGLWLPSSIGLQEPDLQRVIRALQEYSG